MTTAAERAAAQKAAAEAANKAAAAAFAAKRKPATTASGHPFAGNAAKVKPAPVKMTFDQAIMQVRLGKTVIRTGCGITPADVAAADWTVA